MQHGTLAVEVDGRSLTLAPGDAVSFNGDVPHSYANPGTEPARFTLAVLEPGVATARPSGAHGA